jgi:hypothetical protein
MTKQRALHTILAIASFGMAFSGYLTSHELFEEAAPACTPVGAAGTLLGYPPCVYGLLMYAAIVVVTTLGLRSESRAGHARRHHPPMAAH